jgi:hypothetical protein
MLAAMFPEFDLLRSFGLVMIILNVALSFASGFSIVIVVVSL